MKKQYNKNKLQIRNSTAEFLTFAYQSKGELNEISVTEYFSATASGGRIEKKFNCRVFLGCSTVRKYRLFESDFDKALKMFENKESFIVE